MKQILIALLIPFLSSCENEVIYEYGKFKNSSEWAKTVNNEDNDTNYIHFQFFAIGNEDTSKNKKLISIVENENKTNYYLKKWVNPWTTFKIKKETTYFFLSGLTGEKIFKINIDSKYHRGYIFQQNDSNKLLCNFTDENLLIR